MLQHIFSFHNLYNVSPDVKINEKQRKLQGGTWVPFYLNIQNKINIFVSVLIPQSTQFTLWGIGPTQAFV